MCIHDHTYVSIYTQGLGTPTASQHNTFDLDPPPPVLMMGFERRSSMSQNLESNALPIQPPQGCFLQLSRDLPGDLFPCCQRGSQISSWRFKQIFSPPIGQPHSMLLGFGGGLVKSCVCSIFVCEAYSFTTDGYIYIYTWDLSRAHNFGFLPVRTATEMSLSSAASVKTEAMLLYI